MLAGNIPGKTGTISQKIAMDIQEGDYATAGVWVAIVMLIAILVIFSMNFISGTKMKNIKRWQIRLNNILHLLYVAERTAEIRPEIRFRYPEY